MVRYGDVVSINLARGARGIVVGEADSGDGRYPVLEIPEVPIPDEWLAVVRVLPIRLTTLYTPRYAAAKPGGPYHIADDGALCRAGVALPGERLTKREAEAAGKLCRNCERQLRVRYGSV